MHSETTHVLSSSPSSNFNHIGRYFKLPINNSTDEDKVQQWWPSSNEAPTSTARLIGVLPVILRRSDFSTAAMMPQRTMMAIRRRGGGGGGGQRQDEEEDDDKEDESLHPSGRGMMILALTARIILRFSLV